MHEPTACMTYTPAGQVIKRTVASDMANWYAGNVHGVKYMCAGCALEHAARVTCLPPLR